ncbi:MAG TPA: type II toxin-antitoxin system RelE/ParE family toxin [Candidatus Solibacter sp.]|nr:type II toxin-antitoxin system RelE/ParE family toxin [Candidatus Solibacter sp.]
MGVRVSAEAELELDDIWYYTATESSSIEIAQRLIDSITDQFALLSKSPFLGRRRDDLKVGLRGTTVGEYVIIYRVEGADIVILHVLHGRRDIRSIVQ